MLDTLQTVLIAIATFSIVVAVHEYGHFWVARRSGVKVLRFSVGFGRPSDPLAWPRRGGVRGGSIAPWRLRSNGGRGGGQCCRGRPPEGV